MRAEDIDPAPDEADDLEISASFVGNDTESQDIHLSQLNLMEHGPDANEKFQPTHH